MLEDNQQVPLFASETGAFVGKSIMVNHIEVGSTSLGKPIHSCTRAYLWGGHAYRRGIAHYLATSGVEVGKIQSLLRHSATSTTILRYLGKAMSHSSASLAQEAPLGSTLNTVRAEIKTLAAQLQAQQAAAAELRTIQAPLDLRLPTTLTPLLALPTTSQSSSSSDAMPERAAPPLSTHAFVVCARETPTEGKLHVRRPHEVGLTLCNWAFLASTWASVVQDIPSDVTLGTRDWCPRCAAHFTSGAQEELAGHSSSSNSQSTSSCIST
jgi:hypothetical protein